MSEHVMVKKRTRVHAGTSLNFYSDEMHIPGGNTEYWDYVEHKFNAAAVVPILTDKRVILVRQYRPAVERYTWEIPAGAREGGVEDPYQCALRELREETGYVTDSLQHLCSFRTAVAYCNELIEIYLAKDLSFCKEQELDPAESIDVKAFEIKEIRQMIQDGILQDGKTIAGILCALEMIEERGNR